MKSFRIESGPSGFNYMSFCVYGIAWLNQRFGDLLIVCERPDGFNKCHCLFYYIDSGVGVGFTKVLLMELECGFPLYCVMSGLCSSCNILTQGLPQDWWGVVEAMWFTGLMQEIFILNYNHMVPYTLWLWILLTGFGFIQCVWFQIIWKFYYILVYLFLSDICLCWLGGEQIYVQLFLNKVRLLCGLEYGGDYTIWYEYVRNIKWFDLCRTIILEAYFGALFWLNRLVLLWIQDLLVSDCFDGTIWFWDLYGLFKGSHTDVACRPLSSHKVFVGYHICRDPIFASLPRQASPLC